MYNKATNRIYFKENTKLENEDLKTLDNMKKLQKKTIGRKE